MASPDRTRPSTRREGVPVAAGQLPGPADGLAQRALGQFPGPGVDRLDAEGVGDQPVGPGGDLAQQVAVAGGGHAGRGAGQDLEVGHHRPGAGQVMVCL